LIPCHVAAGELVTNSCHIHNYANMIRCDLLSDLWDPSRCKLAMWENINGSSSLCMLVELVETFQC
jgi:hypothetical protein